MASRGAIIAAFLAGASPAVIPVAMAIDSPVKALPTVIESASSGDRIFTIVANIAVRPSPANPPAPESKAASATNCRVTSLRVAPTALHIPVCRRLSSTDTYIIFAIPNPPTRREKKPIIQPNLAVRSNISPISSSNPERRFIAKLSFSPGGSRLSSLIILLISSGSVSARAIELLTTELRIALYGISIARSTSTGETVFMPLFENLPITSHKAPSTLIQSPHRASTSAPTTVTGEPCSNSLYVNSLPEERDCRTRSLHSPATPVPSEPYAAKADLP